VQTLSRLNRSYPGKDTTFADTGAGTVQEKQKACIRQIIARLNELFTGVGDEDQLFYVDGVLKGKLLQSEVLIQQALNNSKEQFGASPDLNREIMNAIISALNAHTVMST
jgi:type I restriction enzyme R subunit